MIIPIVSIPPSIANGLKHYKDLFPRSETFQHIQEYCTGMVVLDKPSIKRISQCFVDGPCQSSLNKSITALIFLSSKDTLSSMSRVTPGLRSKAFMFL